MERGFVMKARSEPHFLFLTKNNVLWTVSLLIEAGGTKLFYPHPGIQNKADFRLPYLPGKTSVISLFPS